MKQKPKYRIRAVCLLLCLSLALPFLAGCGEKSSEPPEAPTIPVSQEPPPPEPEPPSPEEEFERQRLEILNENANFLGGLTTEQMQSDYDYLWDTLRTGYPFLGVVRRAGIDPEAVFEEYREKLETVDSDILFLNLIAQMTAALGNMGHLYTFMSAAEYDSYHDLYESLSENPHHKQLFETLETPKARKAYQNLSKVERQVLELHQRLLPDAAAESADDQIPEDSESPDSADSSPAEDGDGEGDEPPAPPSGNIRTEILEEGEIAYLAVSSFAAEYVEADKDDLREFFGEVQKYPHLIIDITGNGGGSDAYWMENIVAPLANGRHVLEQHILFASDAPANQDYLASIGVDEAKPLDELPELPELNEEDREALDRFLLTETAIAPASDSVFFNGDIWLLVDGAVYSSSETFAMFCKNTGFASVVGETTGGDGGGVDPNLIILPESGVVVRYSIFYTINPDGSNSEETGTVPDLPAAGGDILNACLQEIRGESKQ